MTRVTIAPRGVGEVSPSSSPPPLMFHNVPSALATKRNAALFKQHWDAKFGESELFYVHTKRGGSASNGSSQRQRHLRRTCNGRASTYEAHVAQDPGVAAGTANSAAALEALETEGVDFV